MISITTDMISVFNSAIASSDTDSLSDEAIANGIAAVLAYVITETDAKRWTVQFNAETEDHPAEYLANYIRSFQQPKSFMIGHGQVAVSVDAWKRREDGKPIYSVNLADNSGDETPGEIIEKDIPASVLIFYENPMDACRAADGIVARAGGPTFVERYAALLEEQAKGDNVPVP